VPKGAAKRDLLAYFAEETDNTTDFAEMLAERRVSPMVDVYYVYRVAVLGDGGDAPEGQRPYLDPEAFFSITYITPAVRQYTEDFLRRLSRGEPGVYLMPARLGAGKSHFLALLIHLVALYRSCGGSGACVKEALGRHGLELEAPDVPKLPEVYMFHGEHELGKGEAKLRRARTKEELAALLPAPFVAVLDEAQHFEKREPDFPLWLQMLVEVAVERGGLVVSIPILRGERPKSVDVVRRANPVEVLLDVADNIVDVFRRWANVKPRNIDLSPLKSAVDGALFSEFARRLRETYPFNPCLVEVLTGLAKAPESGAQLTRGLLWALASAYVAAKREGATLATFRHLPEPGEFLLAGGGLADEWQKMVQAYGEDAQRVGDNKAATSALRHALFASLLVRIGGGRYPSYSDLVLGAYDGVAKPSDVAALFYKIGGLRLLRLGNAYLYLPVRDAYSALAEALKEFGEADGLDVAAEALVELLQEHASYFDAVYVSGFGPQDSQNGKLQVLPSREEWERRLRNSRDAAVLAADLSDFGVPARRNNLAALRRNDSAPPPPSEVLRRLGIEVATARDAAVRLGMAVKAAKAVLKNPAAYFGAVPGAGNEVEEALRAKASDILSAAKAELKSAVQVWLSRALLGFREVQLQGGWGDYFPEWKRAKDGALRAALRELLRLTRGRFVKVGDLWSAFLNREDMPFAPASFAKFAEALKGHCRDCNCLFEVGGVVKWVGERGCEVPMLGEDVGVALAVIDGRINAEVVERFLRQLASDCERRYAVVYRAPGGEEVVKYADELLAEPGEWPRLLYGAQLRAEKARRAAVRAGGAPASKVEVQPGEPIDVEVEAEGLEAVEYELGGVAGRAEAEGGLARLAVEAPRKPGTYALRLILRLAGGAEERRTVAVSVRGKCAVEPAMGVSAGDSIRWIRAHSIADVAYFFERLSRASVAFTLALKARWQSGGSSVEVNALLSPKDREHAVRLLKLLELMRADVGAEFKFDEPVAVDEQAEALFRGRSAEYGVVKCAEGYAE